MNRRSPHCEGAGFTDGGSSLALAGDGQGQDGVEFLLQAQDFLAKLAYGEAGMG